jgi:hypothetical protein
VQSGDSSNKKITKAILAAAKHSDTSRRISIIRPKNVKSPQKWVKFVRYRLSNDFKVSKEVLLVNEYKKVFLYLSYR